MRERADGIVHRCFVLECEDRAKAIIDGVRPSEVKAVAVRKEGSSKQMTMSTQRPIRSAQDQPVVAPMWPSKSPATPRCLTICKCRQES